MHTLDQGTEAAARAFVRQIAQQYDLAGAIVFGSRARGDAHAESDADVAVLLHGEPGKFIDTKLDMLDIAYDTLLATGIRIQPLPIWEAEWAHPESYSNPHLLYNIDREGIRL